MATDWRLPENRREGFLRLYDFLIQNQAHSELTYIFLPAILDAFEVKESEVDKAVWLAWLDGNTQSPVTTYLLYEVAPSPDDFPRLEKFVTDNYDKLVWDTDRRHQKRHFISATSKLLEQESEYGIAAPWYVNSANHGGEAVWRYALSLPYMGRLSAWGLMEKVRLVSPRGWIPDLPSMMLEDVNGSHSYRNGLALIAGYDAAYWDKPEARDRGIVGQLDNLAEELLEEARQRNDYHLDATRATLETALCMYKLMWKPRQRYPRSYIDRSYSQLLHAEGVWGRKLDVLHDALDWSIPQRLHPEETGGWDPKLAELFRDRGVLLDIDKEVIV